MTRAYRKNPQGRTSHGHAGRGQATKTYRAWQNMRRRCLYEGSPQYKDYGGRGITICAAWDSFTQFLADMGEAPASKSLDRRDNNGGYNKGNCRWATRREQNQNTRKNINVTYRGKTQCLSAWARELKIAMLTLYGRLYLGNWSVDRAFTTPPVRGRNQFETPKITYNNETHTVPEWAKKMGMKPGTLHMRLWRGWPLERALKII